MKQKSRGIFVKLTNLWNKNGLFRRQLIARRFISNHSYCLHTSTKRRLTPRFTSPNHNTRKITSFSTSINKRNITPSNQLSHRRYHSNINIFKHFKRKILSDSQEVANTGSQARDHLANERTFLAWARTSLALIGAGIALETLEFDTLHEYQSEYVQYLKRLNKMNGKNENNGNNGNNSNIDDIDNIKPSLDHLISLKSDETVFLNSRKKHIAALTFICLGGTFMCYSTFRYFQVLRGLNKGMYKPNVYGILGVVGISAIIISGALYFIENETNFSDFLLLEKEHKALAKNDSKNENTSKK